MKEILKLRKLKISDLDKLCKLFLDSSVLNTLGGLMLKELNKKKEAKWLKENIAKYKLSKPGSLSWVIEVNGEFVGGIGFHDATWRHQKTEIGYWIGKDYWGRGYATEALKQFKDFLFKKYKFKRIYAVALVHNIASQKVLEKAGFQYEGTLKKNSKFNNKFYDDKLYAIVRK